MDAETGNIYFLTKEKLLEKEEELGRKLVPLESSEAEKLRQLTKQARKNKVRNQSCVCGSGKKLKHCCLHLFTGKGEPYKKGLAEIFKRGEK